MAVFVVSRIDDYGSIGFNPVARGILRMVQRKRNDLDPASLHMATGFDGVEVAARSHLIEVDGEIRLRHLAFQRFLERPSFNSGEERDVILRTVDGDEERQTLDVIPVKVGEEEFDVQRLSRRFFHEGLAQIPDTTAGVKNEDVVRRRSNLDAGRVAAESKIFHLGSGGRAPHSPEPEPYPGFCH